MECHLEVTGKDRVSPGCKSVLKSRKCDHAGRPESVRPRSPENGHFRLGVFQTALAQRLKEEPAPKQRSEH